MTPEVELDFSIHDFLFLSLWVILNWAVFSYWEFFFSMYLFSLFIFNLSILFSGKLFRFKIPVDKEIDWYPFPNISFSFNINFASFSFIFFISSFNSELSLLVLPKFKIFLMVLFFSMSKFFMLTDLLSLFNLLIFDKVLQKFWKTSFEHDDIFLWYNKILSMIDAEIILFSSFIKLFIISKKLNLINKLKEYIFKHFSIKFIEYLLV